MTTASKFVTKSITAENVFSDVMQMDKGQMAAMSVSGIAGGTTVFLQRRFNQAGDWRDVASYTADQELGFVAECGMEIRMGVKTGGWGSGTTVIDIKVG